MISIGKPILIAAIFALFLAYIGSYLPAQIPGFSLVDEAAILAAVHGLAQTVINQTAFLIDWAFVFVGISVLIWMFGVYLTFAVFFLVLNWAIQSQ